MEGYTRTDLAEECLQGRAKTISGVEQRERQVGSVRVLDVRVKTAAAAKEIGKPMGRYVTLECGRIDRLTADASESMARLIAGELRGMTEAICGRKPDASLEVLVIGLGNAELTADAIGPDTVRRLTATRHLRSFEAALFHSLGCSSVSLLAPGVLGQTGIEVQELLKGAVERVKPHLVVVLDALAARDCDRLAATVQISDTGIVPGSGVGNRRSALNRETLGVPVLSLGVPTVVDSATLVYDALCKAGIGEIPESLRAVLENGRSFFVSLKESDQVTEKIAELLARAIGLAFTDALTESKCHIRRS